MTKGYTLNKWSELKEELGFTPDKNEVFERFWAKYDPELCVNRDVNSLVPLLKQEFGTKLPDDYSLLVDGFVNRFEANKSIWPVIDHIHSQVRVGLLTNAYLGMLGEIRKRGILPNVNWDVIVDSSIVRLQKPDPKIFQLAEEKARMKGTEILFVENSPGHVDAAQKFGWQTFLYDSASPEDSSMRLAEFWGKFN